MKLGTVTVSLYVGGAWVDLNMADPEAGREGAASVIDKIVLRRSVTGPAGHDAPSEVSVSILSGSPVPYTRGTRTIIYAVIDPETVRPTAPLADVWVDTDTVTRYSASKWLHRLTFRDPVAKAADLKLAAARGPSVISVTAEWLNTTYPNLFAIDIGAFGPGSADSIAPVAAGTDLLTLARKLCTSGAARLALRDGFLVASPAPALRGWTWWDQTPPYAPAALPRQVSAAALTEGAAVTSSASHISTVAVAHFAGDLTTAAETVTTDGGDYQTLTLDTLIAAIVHQSDASLARLQRIASAVVAAPPQPVLDPVTVQDLGPGNSLLLGQDEGFSYGLLDIDPVPAQAGRFHVLTGAELSIGHGRQIALTWQIVPASLYGMVPIRPSHLGADRFTDTAHWAQYEHDQTYPTRYRALAANLPK